jgi:hypothetical protein
MSQLFACLALLLFKVNVWHNYDNEFIKNK